LLKKTYQSVILGKEFTLIRKDNNKFHAELSIGVLRGKNSKPEGYIVIIRDESEKATLLNQLEKETASFLSITPIKTKFLSDLSFEIRSSINSLIGFVNLLYNNKTSESDGKTYIENIQNSSNILSRIVNDIIDFSKLETGNFHIVLTKINVQQLLHELFDNIKDSPFTIENPRIDFRLKIDKNIGNLAILSDNLRLKQVLTNLIENAFRNTDSGFIEIAAEIIQNKSIQFSVKDSGFGIPKEKQANIFQKDFDTEVLQSRSSKSTKLGLIISKSISESLGGEIFLESEPGKGSSFMVSLPISREKSEILKKEITQYNLESDEVFDWENRKILIAEDIDSNFFYFEAILKRTKAKILRAKNGREAIEIVKTNPEISLILMDIQMPELNGYKATSIIKNLRDDIIVIAQTAHGFAHEKQKILNSGFDNFIAKPVNANELLKMISSYY